MSPLDRKLLRDLRRMWPQAAATALVIGCGIAVFIAMLGAMQSLRATRDAYYERSRFADLFVHARRVPRHMADRLAQVPGVLAVDTRIVRSATVTVEGFPELVTAQIVSVPDYGTERLNRLTIRLGRRPQAERTGEIVVNEAFAQAHRLGPGDKIDAQFGGKRRRLEIVGVALSPEFVYALPPGALLPDDRRFAVIWMGHEAMAAAFDLESAFDDALIALAPGADRPAVMAAVDRLLEPFGGLGAYARADQTSAFIVDNEIAQLENFSAILPAIFLTVAALLLNAVSRRLVASEREIIGVLRAFGYPAGRIAAHYMRQVLVITLLGLALGLGFGSWLAGGMLALYADYFRFPFLTYRFEPAIYLLAALLGLVAGLAGALQAVRDVLRLEPAVAMRPPTPPTYRFGGRLALWSGRALDQPTLMILRHIFRWPLRAGATVLGIAAALALLLTAFQWIDAIEDLILHEFFAAQRQDITVSFDEAISSDVLASLRQLPGVLRIEPRRAVPVRLRHGHRNERRSLLAVRAGAELERALDARGRPLVPDPYGVLLADSLARRLDIRRGERLRVEALEGARRAIDIPVSGIFEAFLGEPVYAAGTFADSLTGEPDRVAQVALQVDPAHLTELRRRLALLPHVASVEERQARIRAFRDTMAESIGIMTAFYVGFAAALTFGVVYNAGRIAVSERARELASLRVLGFTALETSYVVVGELLLLALAALPLGLAGGYGLVLLVAMGLENELFRLPTVVHAPTVARAAGLVLLSAAVTALLVARRIWLLDPVAALKTRE